MSHVTASKVALLVFLTLVTEGNQRLRVVRKKKDPLRPTAFYISMKKKVNGKAWSIAPIAFSKWQRKKMSLLFISFPPFFFHKI